MAAKMEKSYDVTVDFLIVIGESASYDKETILGINGIQKLDNSTRSIFFNVQLGTGF